MPPTKTPSSSKRGISKDKGAVRAKSGCYTCRIRRKKCDEHLNEQKQCTTCVRLRIECIGFGEKRPVWLRDNHMVKELLEKIKDHLSKQGMIKGHSSAGTRGAEGDQFLRLTPDEYSEAGTPPTPILSLTEPVNHHHHISSMRDDHDLAWSTLVGYSQGSTSLLLPGNLRDDSPSSSHGSPYHQQFQLLHVDTVLSPARGSSFSRHSNFRLSDDSFESIQPISTPPTFPFFLSPSPSDMHVFIDQVLEYYKQTVVTAQYLFADDDVRDSIRATVTSHGRSRHAASLLASVHYQRFCNPTAVAFETQETQARMNQLWSLLDEQDLASGDAMAALHVVSSYLFDGGIGQWENWIHVSYHYVRQLFDKFNGYAEALMHCDPKDAFIIKTSLWFDVLASVTTQKRPRYLDAIRALFDPNESRIFQISSSDQDSMMSPMGCRNEVLWALAETSHLSVWKKEEMDKGSLSMPTLIKYGMVINDVLTRSVEPSASADIHGCRTLASELFRSSARIYLQAVLSGDHPHVPEIVESVEDTIDCMKRLFHHPATTILNGQIMSHAVVRNTVFSFFICGAFAEKEEHRNVVGSLLMQEDVGTGNCGTIHQLLLQLWKDRTPGEFHGHAQAVDWRSLLSQHKLLLV